VKLEEVLLLRNPPSSDMTGKADPLPVVLHAIVVIRVANRTELGATVCRGKGDTTRSQVVSDSGGQRPSSVRLTRPVKTGRTRISST
jgi:hypothetical protein